MCDCTLRLVWMWLCYFLNCTDSLPSSKLPSCSHQLFIVVIVVNRSWNGRVVIIPFLSRDSTISIFVSKVREELHKDLILSHCSVDDLGVETAIVYSLEVTGVNPTVSITIKLKVSLVSDCLSFRIQVSLKFNISNIFLTLIPTKNSSKLIELSPSVSKAEINTYIENMAKLNFTSMSCLEIVRPSSLRPT